MSVFANGSSGKPKINVNDAIYVNLNDPKNSEHHYCEG